VSERRDLLRAPDAPATPGDITTRDDVLGLVRAFYREAAMDDLLAPVFHAVHVDWADHIPRVTDFWCWQLLGEPAEARNTLGAHERAHALVPFTDRHYERWLAIWTSTVDDRFVGPVAEAAKERARRVARAMQRFLAGDGRSGHPALDRDDREADLP
jgi:hemoglobin